MTPEQMAELFHTHYERLAPTYGWNGPRSTRCAWPDLPANNKALMTATAAEVLKALEAPQWKVAVEEVDQSLTKVADQSGDWVAYYLMPTGPWHRLLGMARA